jgi:hypothetical protein
MIYVVYDVLHTARVERGAGREKAARKTCPEVIRVDQTRKLSSSLPSHSSIKFSIIHLILCQVSAEIALYAKNFPLEREQRP